MDQRLKVGLEAIKESGDFLNTCFYNKHNYSIKKDSTVLIDEDIKSENIIINRIKKNFPQDTFISEEKITEFNKNSVWIIDPLCGSYSYLRGVETWSVSIAYLSKNRLIFGIVNQPYLNNIFYGYIGKGAFLNDKPVKPSNTHDVGKAFVSIEHGVFNDDRVNLKSLIKTIKRLRVGHGSGGELSYVASGYLDAVIKTKQTLMHFAGGQAIIEAAGGVFLNFKGENAPICFDRNKKIDYIACSNIVLAKKILKYF